MGQKNAQYTVVKFVPDAVRFEPINIGIVLETDDAVITSMSQELDPRIRFADPFADVKSLADFMQSFDASALQSNDASVVASLTEGVLGYPNLYFDGPHSADVSTISAGAIADILFDRIVRRDFARPSGFQRPMAATAARTALKKAFAAVHALGPLVSPSVQIEGKSGINWEMDFRFLTSEVCFVQTATTGLRGDLRRREHAFRAFSALIDTAGSPGTVGILAVDDPPERNEMSANLSQMAGAHGLQFFGGQRAFFELASAVRNNARPVPVDDIANTDSQGVLPI